MYDIVVTGAGTAGLSAAIYGQRAGKNVLVLEEKNYGGQIINTPKIENYPGIVNVSGFEFATRLYEQAVSTGAKVLYEQVLEIKNTDKDKIVRTNKSEYHARTVIIATGAKNRLLGIEKEEKLTGAGVSYCATCDGMFFRGRDAAVFGGGNTALEDAAFLSEYCRRVFLIHRRESFRGEEKLEEALHEKKNVSLILNSVVTELYGEDSLEGINVRNVKDGTDTRLNVSGLFIAIGQMPDCDRFSNLVELDKNGYIAADENCKTHTDGIFAAGDCRTKKVRQLTTAAADGAVAAIAACEYINRKTAL